MRTAIVVGSTGLVGGHLLDRLAEDLTWDRVVSLARRRSGRRGIEERVVEFDRLDEGGAIACDDVFCALGTTIRKAGSQKAFRQVDLEYVEAVARVTRAGGARQFLLVSSVGADPRARNFYLSVKGQAEVAVREEGFDSVQVFRPSLLLGSRQESRPIERAGMLLARLVRPLTVGALERYRAIPGADVAMAMVAAARTPGSGFRVHTHREMRTLLSADRVTGQTA